MRIASFGIKRLFERLASKRLDESVLNTYPPNLRSTRRNAVRSPGAGGDGGFYATSEVALIFPTEERLSAWVVFLFRCHRREAFERFVAFSFGESAFGILARLVWTG